MISGSSREALRTALRECGFDLVGFTAPDPAPDAERLRDWLDKGRHASMDWMARDPESRIDVRRRFPWARTVVCGAVAYDSKGPTRESCDGATEGWISRYAWGRDYHKGLRNRLRRACELLREHGADETKPYVDTGPLLERSLHQSAGTGWIGKNTCLIDPQWGSFLFLGEVVTDLEIEPDTPETDRCGSCTLCLDACPTGAFVGPGELDSNLCISYQTIENRDSVDADLRKRMGAHLFGCDICQDVCPWNLEAPVPDVPEFQPRDQVASPELASLARLSESAFDSRFAGTPVRRARYEGFLRNVCIAMGNARSERHRPLLEELSRHPLPLVREHARWALETIDRAG